MGEAEVSIDWSALAGELDALVRTGLTDDAVQGSPHLRHLVRQRAPADLSDQACADAVRRLIAISSLTEVDWAAFTPIFNMPAKSTLAQLQRSIGPLFGVDKDGAIGTGVSERRKQAAWEMGINERTYRDHQNNILSQYAKILAALDQAGDIWRSVFPALEMTEGGSLSDTESDLPKVVRDIVRLSDSLSDDIASTISGIDAPPAGMLVGRYVPRNIESVVQTRVMDDAHGGWITVVGEAGHGKTCLLWSINRAFRAMNGVRSLLISASWFLGDAISPALLAGDDITRACEFLLTRYPRVVVLLDTADLLLHAESVRRQTLLLLGQLDDLGVSSILTTRPLEAESLPLEANNRFYLGAYDDAEIRNAADILSSQFCPTATDIEPIERILDAVARNLPVEDVCRSPLLLRMLFELSAPLFPALEIDVTGIYRRYWARRVVTDSRLSATVLDRSGTEDLATPAGMFGLAMLALGTPESPRDPLVRQAAAASRGWGHSLERQALHHAVTILARRGVMHVVADRVRFMHQTLFEFATAMALLDQGRPEELRRLLDLVAAQPEDMFAGAVLEQVLILAGDDPLLARDVGDSIRWLLGTGNASLQSAAIRVWAHHPQLAPHDHELTAARPDLLREFPRVAITVQRGESAALMVQLGRLWSCGDPNLQKAVIEALVKLGKNDPAEIASTVRRLGVVETCLRDRMEYVVSQDEVTDLVLANTAEDPNWAKARLLQIIQSVGAYSNGKRRTVSLLDALASIWPILGDRDYLDQVVHAVIDRELQGDRDAIHIRRALAAIFSLQWRRELAAKPSEVDRDAHWNAIVDSAASGLESDDESIVAGSQSIAIALTLIQLPADHRWIALTFDKLLDLRGASAPYQLPRGFFPVLLDNRAPAGDAAASVLGATLGALALVPAGLVAERQHMWAGIARRCLVHRDVPAHRVAAAVRQSSLGNQTSHWLKEELLLQLTPAAAAGGHQVALTALHQIVQDPARLSKRDQGILLTQCLERRGGIALLDEITIVLTIALRRLPALTELAEETPQPLALIARRATIRHLVATYLDGDDQAQRDGAAVWRKLRRLGVLVDSPADVMDRIRSLRGPVPKAAAVGLLADVVQPDSPDWPPATNMLRAMINSDHWKTNGLTANPCSPQKPLVIDAARDSLLQMLSAGSDASPGDWPLTHALACAPRLTGSREVDLTGFKAVTGFLVNLAEQSQVSAAHEGLLDMIESLRSDGFDRKKLVNASYWLRPAIRAVLHLGSDSQVEALLREIETAPPRMGAFIVQVAVQQRFDLVQPHLMQMQTRPLPAGVAATIDTMLRRRNRTVGSRTLPELLKPA